jgi:Fe-Mn family superoxide dismutase
METTMTTELDRRSFVQTGSALTAGAAMAAAIWPADAAAQTPAPAPATTPAPTTAKPMTFTPKPMPFDPKKIKGLSEKLLVSHYENNYTGAVKRLNAILEQLASLDYAKAPGFLINGLKREELIATNSMILHEVYFAGLGDESQPGEALSEALARDFGSLDRWRAEFVAMGKAEGGGSGWVVLNWDPRDKRLVNAWAADHTTTLAGGRPILVLDMYEHAYHMDYGAKAGDYVEAYMHAIRWNSADNLYAQYS